MKRKKVLSFLICISCLVSACTCFAVTTDHRMITWNMQGAAEKGSNGSQSKWTAVIPQMLNSQGDNAGVLALQESGSLPLGTTPAPQAGAPDRHGEGADAIEEVVWNLGTRTRENNVYIYHLDATDRVNLSIVSRVRAQEILVFPIPLPDLRPIFGIRIGDDYFFNIHAGAYPTNQAPNQVNEVHRYMANTAPLPSQLVPPRANANWIIMGDFNRAPCIGPGALAPRLDQTQGIEFQIINTEGATHTGGTLRELDYAIIGRRIPAPPAPPLGTGPAFLSEATLTQHLSDHFGVLFAPPPHNKNS